MNGIETPLTGTRGNTLLSGSIPLAGTIFKRKSMWASGRTPHFVSLGQSRPRHHGTSAADNLLKLVGESFQQKICPVQGHRLIQFMRPFEIRRK